MCNYLMYNNHIKENVPHFCGRCPVPFFVVIPLVFMFVLSCSPSKTEIKNGEDSPAKAETVSVLEKSTLKMSTFSMSALTPDEEKLIRLLNSGSPVFSDAKGEAQALIENIIANKKSFLSDLEAVFAADTDNLLIRVDKSVYLPDGYVPEGLVPLTAETAKAGSYVIHRGDLSLRAPVEQALARMARSARENGITLVVSSTYRSYAYQTKVYERNVAQMGKEAADRESARPGTSQHQLGTVIDFGSITDEYAQTSAGKWLYENAGKYGWSLSFPDGYEFITGYRWECWHYRYVGPLAVDFQEKWFNNVQQYMIEFIHAWKNAEI